MMIRRYIDWTHRIALPTWLERGYDRQAERFRERLLLGGEPVSAPHRAMVQARQIYTFAHAAKLGWFADGASAAERAMHQLEARFAETANGATSFVFSIDPASGAVHDAKRDSYTHAFVLLAIAHLYELTGSASLLSLAERVTRFVENNLTDMVHGGVLNTSHSPVDAPKRQNPQMHLLEAYLALERVAPERGYGERALALVRLFEQRLFNDGAKVLIEHFGHDWRPHPDIDRGSLWEPGHHYEWVWLLDQAKKILGRSSSHARSLRETADRHGIAPNGLIYDELDTGHAVISPGHRLWPHTEAIKAAAVGHASGFPDARDFADTMAGTMMTHFLDQPFVGGWIDHRNANLSPRSKDVPASSLYHLFLAATEADAAFGLAGPTSDFAASAVA